MTQNFDALKKQLAELQELVNSFKSEAVQLRIVDALMSKLGLEVTGLSEPDEPEDEGPKPARRKSKPVKKAKKEGAAQKPSTSGPKGAILALIADKYFDTKRTAPEVKEHLATKKARTYTIAAVQNALNRLLHNDTMDRDRHAETNQLQYWKK